MSVISRRVRAVAAIVAAAGFAVTATSTAAGANPKSAGGSVVEASVIAYTGSNSFEGGVTDAGLYPAAYEINSAGGILGHKLSIDPVDTRGDPADALPLVEKMLATTPNLVGVTGCGTTSGPTLIPVFNSDHVVMMCAAGEAKYDRNKNKYFWRLVPPDPANGIAMAIWAKRHKLTSVAAVFGTTSSAQGDLPGVLAGVKDAHMKLVANIGLTPDQPSYRTQVEQLISDHPQVIMTESDGPTAATFFGELKQLGGGHLVPIYGTEATVTSSWLKPVRGAIGTVDFNKYFTGIIGGTPAPSPAHQASHDLDEAALATRELAAVQVGRVHHLEAVEDLPRTRTRLGLLLFALPPSPGRLPEGRPFAAACRRHEVLEDRHALELARRLERTRDAKTGPAVRRQGRHVPALEPDVAGRSLLLATERSKQGGLSRSVRPDKPEHLAPMDLEGHARHGQHPSVTDDDVLARKDRLRAGLGGGSAPMSLAHSIFAHRTLTSSGVRASLGAPGAALACSSDWRRWTSSSWTGCPRPTERRRPKNPCSVSSITAPTPSRLAM